MLTGSSLGFCTNHSLARLTGFPQHDHVQSSSQELGQLVLGTVGREGRELNDSGDLSGGRKGYRCGVSHQPSRLLSLNPPLDEAP